MNRYPLVELKVRRAGCLQWMQAHGYPEPPRSACVYCPYQRRDEWEAKKKAGGADWDLVLDVSRRLAERGEFLTKHCLPIEQVDFSDPEKDQEWFSFQDECEGMCGV